MNKKRLIGIILIIAGTLIIISNITLTGAVIGAPSSNYLSILGVLTLVVGVVLTLQTGRVEGELERKLKQIRDIKTRRELLSDAHRAERFAEKGLDVNALWDPSKTYEENKKNFLEKFYDNVDNEIIDAFWKFRYRKTTSKEEFDNNLEQYTDSEEYKEFKEKALRMILLWNEKVLSREFVPLYIKESKEKIKDHPGQKSRVVYYGLKELKGKSNTFYTKTGRKEGDVVVAHEIINPEAIENPDKLSETPHIHWELEYIMEKNYKFD